MGGIFISYRRDETEAYAGRLRDRLSHHFGAGQVFRDIDRIDLGERFPEKIETALNTCDALLALIGPTWLSIADEDGGRRIDDPGDYLRMEIAAALARPDVLVIPVLINTARMPSRSELPAPLRGLADCQALRVTNDGWDDQVARLIKALEKVVATERYGSQARTHPQQPPAAWRSTAPPPPSPPPPAGRGGGLAVGLVVGLVVLVVLAGLAYGVVKAAGPFFEDFGEGNPTVVLSPPSGRPGTTVTVTGTGYGKEETVEINFHATEVGTVLTEPDGSFTTTVKVPASPFKGQFDIRVTGKRTIRSDSAPFTVL